MVFAIEVFVRPGSCSKHDNVGGENFVGASKVFLVVRQAIKSQ